MRLAIGQFGGAAFYALNFADPTLCRLWSTARW